MTPRKRTIGRPVGVTRKSKAKPYKQEPLVVLDVIESMSDPDAKVKEQIAERRKEEKKTKKGA